MKETLPSNPIVPRGIAILYLGAGKKEIVGTGSGSTYYVSDHHRVLKVFAEDVKDILNQSYFIRKP